MLIATSSTSKHTRGRERTPDLFSCFYQKRLSFTSNYTHVHHVCIKSTHTHTHVSESDPSRLQPLPLPLLSTHFTCSHHSSSIVLNNKSQCDEDVLDDCTRGDLIVAHSDCDLIKVIRKAADRAVLCSSGSSEYQSECSGSCL